MRADGTVRVVAVNGSVSAGGHTASLIRAMCHALALGDLRNLLSGFSAAVVVPPGIYVPDCAWRADQLAGNLAALAVQQSSALVELVSLIEGSRC
jgi:hypothetical protein